MFGDHSTISVAKVIAGWGHSSAFIPGTGLVVWNPVNTHNETHELRANQAVSDGVWIVPFTATITQAEGRTARNKAKLPDDHRGSVVNWVILEGWVVYVTDTGRYVLFLLYAISMVFILSVDQLCRICIEHGFSPCNLTYCKNMLC